MLSRANVKLSKLAASSLRCMAAKKHTFTVKEFKGHALESLPSNEVELDREDALKYFKDMFTIRRMETVAGEMYRGKHIRGFCHLYSGQEAVCVGMKAAMRDVDSLTTAYRCHGWAHCWGYSVKSVLAELFGNYDGASLGKGGSMHFYGERFYGGNGIVGAQVPVGAGVGFAHKYLGDGGVSFALYGDGASNQGQVFEAYNIAKLWKLPVVFVCENNKFGMGTHDYRSSANTKYYSRGDYIPGIWVDGMDILATRQATEFAIEFAQEHGPIVMEMETYRYHGHSMSDPDTTYRTKDDIKKMRTDFDPIVSLKHRMIEVGFAEEDDLKQIEKDIRNSVKQEANEALQGPEVPIKELTNHIYVEKSANVRGCDPFTLY